MVPLGFTNSLISKFHKYISSLNQSMTSLSKTDLKKSLSSKQSLDQSEKNGVRNFEIQNWGNHDMIIFFYNNAQNVHFVVRE